MTIRRLAAILTADVVGIVVVQRRLLLRCMSLFLARNGPPAMSAVRSLSGVNRTWRTALPRSQFDPTETFGGLAPNRLAML